MTFQRRLAFAFALALAAAPARAAERSITLESLKDKIRGGWAGQMIGVAYGTPTEFRFLQKRIDDSTPIEWSPKNVAFALRQDDLYVDMSFAAVMDKLGIDATAEQYGEAFKDTKYRLWHANASARRLLNMGIKAPHTGEPKYNIHANDIDFQIECDFIGLMCPGLPKESNLLCDRAGRVMNYGDGLYGGYFVCGMYAAAFFESDPRKVVEAGLACLPPESLYAATIRDTLKWSKENPGDWRKTWQLVTEHYDNADACAEGAGRPFNIDASFNGAFIAIGLLYGGGDFGKTNEITTRCGQDSDCNPSNSCGVLGTMLGYEKIPDDWKSGIPEIAKEKFEYTDYSFEEICESTQKRAIELAKRVGGRVEKGALVVPEQAPEPPKLEQWSMGIAKPPIPAVDPAWSYRGKWMKVVDRARGQVMGVITLESGSEAELAFEGTAIAVLGQRTQEGGRADVFLDGAKAGEIDSYIVPLTTDVDLFHAYGLAPGKHTLKIVSRADRDSRSAGNQVIIEGATAFTNK